MTIKAIKQTAQDQKDLAELRPCYSVTGLESFITKHHPSYQLIESSRSLGGSTDYYEHLVQQLTKALDQMPACRIGEGNTIHVYIDKYNKAVELVNEHLNQTCRTSRMTEVTSDDIRNTTFNR